MRFCRSFLRSDLPRNRAGAVSVLAAMSRRRHRPAWDPPSAPVRRINRCRALLVIDNRPLQAAAWAELQRARKRLEKATRDVHRHEETDEPAFRAWLAAAFPTLVSAVREMAEQVEAKSRMVEGVEREAFFTGRPASRIWREWQQAGSRPPEPPSDGNEGGSRASPDEADADPDTVLDEEMRRLFAEEGIDDDDPFAGAFRDVARDFFGFGGARAERGGTDEARAIYRRLVQHLHPDRGGVWTPARARVWDQVQAAWLARDADWLARLEAEWEASADLLGPASALGRLRAALAEIDAARRDVERRVRGYRKQPAWRFSLRPPSEALRGRLEHALRHDEATLRRQLDRIEEAIARWTRPRARGGRHHRHAPSYRFGF
jgi:hypothetical protein